MGGREGTGIVLAAMLSQLARRLGARNARRELLDSGAEDSRILLLLLSSPPVKVL
jgi:hypothetical protein